jgi:hypothetical protein
MCIHLQEGDFDAIILQTLDTSGSFRHAVGEQGVRAPQAIEAHTTSTNGRYFMGAIIASACLYPCAVRL